MEEEIVKLVLDNLPDRNFSISFKEIFVILFIIVQGFVYFKKILPSNKKDKANINDKLDKINTSLLILNDNLNKAKSWDLESYTDQITHILQNTTYKFEKWLYTKVDLNNLVKNKELIRCEITQEAEKTFNEAINRVEKIKFHDEFDSILKDSMDDLLKDIIQKIIICFDVEQGYNKGELKRKISVLTANVINDTERGLDDLKAVWRQRQNGQ